MPVYTRTLGAMALCFLLFATLAPAAEFPPQDHAGANLILADGDEIWGTHTNVGHFVVPEDAVVRVRPYHPDEPGTGTLEVFADAILVEGTITARAAGFRGGPGLPGGGGVRMGFVPPYWYPVIVGTGSPGEIGEVPYEVDGLTETMADGPFGGAFGTDGGYDEPQANGDVSIDDFTTMGSGGGGGEGEPGHFGHNEGGRGGQGGGAGGRGGGNIRLHAAGELLLGPMSLIAADGSTGGNGEPPKNGLLDGGDGGSASIEEEGSGYVNGGAGAGGGILIRYTTASSATIDPDATLSVLGGRQQESNAGTVKIIHPQGEPPPGGLTVLAARYFTSHETLSAVGSWLLY